MLENIPLGPMTTLGVGGPARYVVKIEDEADLAEAVEYARTNALPFFPLGKGSNLLVSDAGFDGVVLQMALSGETRFENHSDGSVDCWASGGEDWDRFVLEVCQRGLTGVECMAGIPGLLGASPVQNIGAYGQEVADTIVRVRVFDTTTMMSIFLSASECGFGYRKSIFNSTQRGRYIVTMVNFRFERGQKIKLKYKDLSEHFAGRNPAPMAVYKAVRQIRHGKGMLLVEGEADCRSAGSFFKNPLVSAAAFSEMAKRIAMAESEISALERRRRTGEIGGGVASGAIWISQGVCDGARGHLVAAHAGAGESGRGDGGGDCSVAG